MVQIEISVFEHRKIAVTSESKRFIVQSDEEVTTL